MPLTIYILIYYINKVSHIQFNKNIYYMIGLVNHFLKYIFLIFVTFLNKLCFDSQLFN